MNKDLQVINAKLSAFMQSKQPAEVRATMDRLDKIADTETAGNIDARIRRQKTQTALRILRAVEEVKDTRFNPADMPGLNVAPPPETGLPSGVAPKDIEDPGLRAQYEAARAENEKKIAYANREVALRHLENEVRQRILSYVASVYARSSESRTELTHLATEAGIARNFTEEIQSKMK